MTEQRISNLAKLLISISGLNGQLKRGVIHGGEGHRVVHKVHQNASKYTKMHQNCHQIMIEQSILNFTCSLIHSSADGVAHEDNSYIKIITQM